ncbi:unnamed protein product, partial [Linum tenue]
YGNFCREDFRAYAEVCFKVFGDRVSHWTTVNEPNILAHGSYDQGISPPGHCSPPFGAAACVHGNSTTEPYLVLHNILLAHASTVELYRRNYQVGWLTFDPSPRALLSDDHEEQLYIVQSADTRYLMVVEV